MIHDDCLELLNQWTRWETFYKELFEKKQGSPAEYQKFLASLDKEQLKEQWYIVPDLFASDHFSFDDNLPYFNMSGSVICTKHARYTPPFMHSHSYFEMLYVYSGVARHKLENSPWTELKAGDVIIIPKGVKHSLIVEDDDTFVLNILLQSHVFQEVFYDVLVWDTLLSRFFWDVLHDQAKASCLYFQTGGDAVLQNIVEYTYVEFRRQEKYYEKVIQSTIRVILALLMRKEEIFYVENQVDKKLEIYRYISNHYQDCTLSSTAADFGYSTAHLSRMIKKETGKTFSEILADYRLHMACRLLRESELQISQICEVVGYQNLTHFNHLFKKTFDMTPTEYRQQQ